MVFRSGSHPSDHSADAQTAGADFYRQIEGKGVLCRLSVAEREGFEPSVPFRAHTLSRRAPSAARPSLRKLMKSDAICKMAERVGFEPTIPVTGYRFSRAAPSAARPPLQMIKRPLFDSPYENPR